MARPRVGISRCLLGDLVRYDGGHKRAPWLLDASDFDVEWIAVCPEVEVGMGVPREPIRLVMADTGAAVGLETVRLRGVESRADWTERMMAWARPRIAELEALGLSGFVLKARSPSCGPDSVPVHHEDGRHFETNPQTSPGMFARILRVALSDLPISDDEQLQEPHARLAFRERVAAYQERLARGRT